MNDPEQAMIVKDNPSPAYSRIYRVCLFDYGAVIPRVELVKATTDAEAIELARNLHSPAQCEIWDEHRLVAEFAPGLLEIELPLAR